MQFWLSKCKLNGLRDHNTPSRNWFLASSPPPCTQTPCKSQTIFDLAVKLKQDQCDRKAAQENLDWCWEISLRVFVLLLKWNSILFEVKHGRSIGERCLFCSVPPRTSPCVGCGIELLYVSISVKWRPLHWCRDLLQLLILSEKKHTQQAIWVKCILPGYTCTTGRITPLLEWRWLDF